MIVLDLDHIFFFITVTATTEIYTLSLHDALPIYQTRNSQADRRRHGTPCASARARRQPCARCQADRKSTRLNSSHTVISYAVFCLKKKKQTAWRSTDPPRPCFGCRFLVSYPIVR